MSTANQEGNGHTFFREKDRNMPFLPSLAWPIGGRLAYMCSSKMILASDNEFHSSAVPITSGGWGVAGGGPVLNGLYKLRLDCFCFKEMHADSSEGSHDCFPACIIHTFALRLAHLSLLPAVINLIKIAVKRGGIFKVK